MIIALEEAARACVACGRHLRDTDRCGREYVDQLVGANRSSSAGSSESSWHGSDPLARQAAQSDWWPPNGDLDDAFEHVFSGHVTFRAGGTPVLSGKHANTPDDRAVVADPPQDASPDAPAVARRVRLPHGELQEELGVGTIVKRHISSMFPPSWSRKEAEAAIREAWFSPSGTREFHQDGHDTIIGGFWTGVGGGIPLEGYFDTVTGRCISTWPVGK
jgi:hypothetical protein